MSDLDDVSLRALARSFYVVRMVRYAVLVVFLVVFTVAGVVTDHPVVALVLGGVVLVLVLAAHATRQRYLSSLRLPPAPASGPSPRAG